MFANNYKQQLQISFDKTHGKQNKNSAHKCNKLRSTLCRVDA